jgi:hypothetical protein
VAAVDRSYYDGGVRNHVLAALACLASCTPDTFNGGDSGIDSGVDSGVDGGIDAVADAIDEPDPCSGTTPNCTTSQLCTSFDSSTSPFAPFMDTHTLTGTLTTSLLRHVSCPASMFSMLDTVSVGTPTRATIFGMSSTPTGGTTATLELDVILPATVTGNVLAFGVATSVNKSTVALGASTSNWYIYAQDTGLTNNLPYPPKPGWNHMKLTVVFAGGTAGATLDYDTVSNGKRTGTYTGGTVGAGSITFMTAEIGLDCTAGSSGPMQAYYDNVVFTAL